MEGGAGQPQGGPRRTRRCPDGRRKRNLLGVGRGRQLYAGGGGGVQRLAGAAGLRRGLERHERHLPGGDAGAQDAAHGARLRGAWAARAGRGARHRRLQELRREDAARLPEGGDAGRSGGRGTTQLRVSGGRAGAALLHAVRLPAAARLSGDASPTAPAAPATSAAGAARRRLLQPARGDGFDRAARRFTVVLRRLPEQLVA